MTTDWARGQASHTARPEEPCTVMTVLPQCQWCPRGGPLPATLQRCLIAHASLATAWAASGAQRNPITSNSTAAVLGTRRHRSPMTQRERHFSEWGSCDRVCMGTHLGETRINLSLGWLFSNVHWKASRELTGARLRDSGLISWRTRHTSAGGLTGSLLRRTAEGQAQGPGQWAGRGWQKLGKEQVAQES